MPSLFSSVLLSLSPFFWAQIRSCNPTNQTNNKKDSFKLIRRDSYLSFFGYGIVGWKLTGIKKKCADASW